MQHDELVNYCKNFNLLYFGTMAPVFYGCPHCHSEIINHTVCDNDCGTFYCGNSECGKEYYKLPNLLKVKGHNPKCGIEPSK